MDLPDDSLLLAIILIASCFVSLQLFDGVF